jgi:uncharacterized protein YjbK
MEIEYKSLLTISAFKDCLNYFSHVATPQVPYLQTNYYFDSSDFVLHKSKITLRLRSKFNQWELTAKIPNGKGNLFSKNLEINLSISENDAKYMIDNGIIVEHPLIQSFIHSIDIPLINNFVFIESLETLRHDFTFYNDTVSLDKNIYNGIIDYELEWETTNHNFVQLELKRLKIKVNNAKGKKSRSFKSLKNNLLVKIC